jgi:hypothetical protein
VTISQQVSPSLLLDVSASNFQKALVGERGMIRNEMGMHSRLEIVDMQGSPCVPISQQ